MKNQLIAGSLKLATLLTAGLCLASFTASAAVITWGPATDTTGKFQFIEGPLVVALNGGANAPNVIGGGASGTSDYLFTAANYTALGPHTFAATAGGPNPRNRTSPNIYDPQSISSTGHLQFDYMIETLTDSWGTTTGITAGNLTLNGLTDSTDYLIQVFFNDQRDPSDNRVMTYGDGNGNNRSLAGGDPAAGVQTAHYGQNVIGSFTASGTSQDLFMQAEGFGNIHFNAILVTAAIPEPSTLALAFFGGFGFLMLRCRRR